MLFHIAVEHDDRKANELACVEHNDHAYDIIIVFVVFMMFFVLCVCGVLVVICSFAVARVWHVLIR